MCTAEVVRNKLIHATSEIRNDFIMLHMAGRDSKTLERVYAYELYHQLRLLDNGQNGNYIWNGEVDKSSHPHFIIPGLRHKKPDLLYHSPGDHSGNMAVVEIKVGEGIRRDTIKKDLITLSSFRRNHDPFRAYQLAIYLIVGGGISKVCQKASDWDGVDGIDLGLIDLFWHEETDTPARQVDWYTCNRI